MKTKKGKILISDPSIIPDLQFSRSIILLVDDNNEGSIGFIINKPLDFELKDLIPLIKYNFPIYYGGPVQQDNLYFIHKIPKLIPQSIKISEDLYWSGNFEIILKLSKNQKINKNDIRFFLGYSGWDANQLNLELDSNSWILSENNYKKDIFQVSDKTIWKNKMIDLGGEYSLWSNAPEQPSHN